MSTKGDDFDEGFFNSINRFVDVVLLSLFLGFIAGAYLMLTI